MLFCHYFFLVGWFWWLILAIFDVYFCMFCEQYKCILVGFNDRFLLLERRLKFKDRLQTQKNKISPFNLFACKQNAVCSL